jgi:hypothetical protein
MRLERRTCTSPGECYGAPALRIAAVFVGLSVALGACAVGVDTGIGDGPDGAPPGQDASADAPSSVEASPGDDGPSAPEAGIDATPGTDAGTSSDGGAHDSGPGKDAAGDGAPATDAGGGKDASGTDASGSDGATGADGGAHDGSTTGCPNAGFSGTLATYDLSAQTGAEDSVAPASFATGVTAGVLTRSGTLTAVSGSGSINSSGWSPSVVADPTKYYTFTVTPAAGCTVTLSSLAVSVQASGSGPTQGDVATSADSFATHTGSLPGTGSATVTLTGVSGTKAVEVRVYGFNASSSLGTYRITSTLKVTGALN